jgi:hypothetical protein
MHGRPTLDAVFLSEPRRSRKPALSNVEGNLLLDTFAARVLSLKFIYKLLCYPERTKRRESKDLLLRLSILLRTSETPHQRETPRT